MGHTTRVVKLLIIHYHLRPGGIRRIIELAVPHFIRESPQPITRLVLATGQKADPSWHTHFEKSLGDLPVEVVVEPAFNYLSEQRSTAQTITARIRHALNQLVAGEDSESCLIWAHNLGVGRNLILSRELTAISAEKNIPLVAHQHDWWFDNRWARWPEMRRFGFRALASPARAVFPNHGNITHAAINHADAAILKRHFGRKALWLPNLTEPAPAVPDDRVRKARQWLRGETGSKDSPVWILPCRSLRRKNIAEAILLTRWLRPEAWLVVTGEASSNDEVPYFQALEDAAHRHHWRCRLGVLSGNEARKPGVGELLAASETVLLTSIQEGFGLPYLEAAASKRPLIARHLPNISPDLAQFGFRFPQAYDEILISPELFHWRREHQRQTKLLRQWRSTMPPAVRAFLSLPPVLAAENSCPVPFSRLTLTAQIEVLAHPVAESLQTCLPLNPFLEIWIQRAAAGKLRVTPWPRTAEQWLSGHAYAHRFFSALSSKATRRPLFSPIDVQTDFIENKLSADNLYPLLWSTRT